MRNTEALIISECRLNKVYLYRVNKAGQALIKNLFTGVKEMIPVNKVYVPSIGLKVNYGNGEFNEEYAYSCDENNDWKTYSIDRNSDNNNFVAENLDIDLESVSSLSNKEYARGLYDTNDDTDVIFFFVNDYTEVIYN